MKKYIILTLCALVSVVACQKELTPEDIANDNQVQVRRTLTFNINVNAPDKETTKSVKTGWVDGDVVFVFFSGAEAPKYAEMCYDGSTSKWVTTAKNELDLADGSGTMTAIYLPFGSDATVAADDALFKFATAPYTYYLTATQPYTVADGEVSGTLSMTAPGHFVQFTIPGEAAAVIPALENGRYRLSVSNVKPATPGSFAAATGVAAPQLLDLGDALPGYVYDGGIQFSGYLPAESDGVAKDYTFILFDSQSTAHSLTLSGKTLSAGKAIKLNAANVWADYNKPEAVNLGLNFKMASRNIGATVDRADNASCWGLYFAWGETTGYAAGSGHTFDAAHYSLANGDMTHLTKYNYDAAKGNDGFVDYKFVLEAADDAATVAYGGLWRMIDYPEFRALWNSCDWAWYGLSDVKGFEIRGRGIYSGNSVFIPASGRWYSSLSGTGSLAEIWCRDLYTNNPANAGYTGWNSSHYVENGSSRSFTSRCEGRVIRAVYGVPNPAPDHEIPSVSYVDMGLSSGLKWASCNLGASSPEESGLYYAWGETIGYLSSDAHVFEPYTYKYSAGRYNQMTKYCSQAENGYNGFTDALTTLEASDDAAHVALGGSWRIPTSSEWDELRNSSNTTWSWNSEKKGYTVTSKINGNSIFLPACGQLTTVGVVDLGSSKYWTASLYNSRCYQAWSVVSNTSSSTASRYQGLVIRPVCD